MKKDILRLILCILSAAMLLCACSCASKEAPAQETSAAEPAAAETAAAETKTEAAPARIDLDLSAMSGNIVYSQILNMMNDPRPFLNKVIKVAGYYTCFEDTTLGTVYHACMIPDAAACCSQGLEFVWGGNHGPADYPQEATDIVVTGRLEMYEENGSNYLHLVDAEVTW